MLAIIGGTGLHKLDGVEPVAHHTLDTPFGPPSAALTEVRLEGRTFIFLPRHGAGHALLPSEINYRANIYALKSMGVTHVVGVSAVGSLAEEIRPGDFALPSQYLDFTKGVRRSTFFGEGILAHISSAHPICSSLASMVTGAVQGTSDRRRVHTGQTYACVEGPRLGTQAESLFLRQAGCHLVGMTNVPEAFLAREAQLCYASLCVVTDYDCWREDPNDHVTVEDVLRMYGEGLADVKRSVCELARSNLAAGCTQCRTLARALLTDPALLSTEKRELLAVLLQ